MINSTLFDKLRIISQKSYTTDELFNSIAVSIQNLLSEQSYVLFDQKNYIDSNDEKFCSYVTEKIEHYEPRLLYPYVTINEDQFLIVTGKVYIDNDTHKFASQHVFQK